MSRLHAHRPRRRQGGQGGTHRPDRAAGTRSLRASTMPRASASPRTGRSYVSGEQGQIYRLDEDGTANEVATTNGWTLGLAADGEGRIYACDPVDALP